jgi:hypothetical protein
MSEDTEQSYTSKQWDDNRRERLPSLLRRYAALYRKPYGEGWAQDSDQALVMEEAADEMERLRERAERAERERDDARQQAQVHAQEARTQRATVTEMLQAATGGTGEPGDWHGAKPVIDELKRLRARAERKESEHGQQQ